MELARTTGSVSQPSTQMSSLHGTRSATADHQEASFCQLLAEKYDLAIHDISARQTVSAHHPYSFQVVVSFYEIGQLMFHGMVVERAGHRFFIGVGELTRCYIMLINPTVVIILFRLRLFRTEAIIERYAIVECCVNQLIRHGLHVLYEWCWIEFRFLNHGWKKT